MTPAPTRLQLLRAPRLLAGEAPLHVGSRKAFALMAVLALDGSAPRERLASLLWPESDAATARRNLRREVFRLRELGVPLHEDGGGALDLGGALAVDAQALLRGCVCDGPVQHALEGLDGVGGAALDDWLQAARDRLVRAWRRSLLQQAQQAEAQGALATALQHYMQLHEADPLREITVRDLMRVHLALGHRSAALQHFAQFVQRARSELAVEPLPETQALAAQVRAKPVDPGAIADAVEAQSSDTATVPTTLLRTAPFVGRDAALQTLQDAFRGTRLLLVTGEAGEGKSRLLAELLAPQGAHVHVTCRPADRTQPFAAAARLLRELWSDDSGSALPADVQREIARVLPEAQADDSAGSAPLPALASSADQQRFFDACNRGVLLLAADNFCAIAIDDWHNADSASRALLLTMAQRAGPGLRWVLAARGSEMDAAANQELDALVYAGAGQRVALGPFDAAAVAALVQRLSGSAAPRFAARLHQATGGNAFFLIETLRHLCERGLVQTDALGLWQTPFDASTDDYHELPIPATVRDAVRARVARLGEAAMRLLEAASLLGSPFNTAWLEGSTSLEDLALVAALEAAEQAHVLAVDDGTPGSYRFTHDLVPQSLAAGLSPARAALLHRKLALALEAAQGGPTMLATRIARHWELAHEPRRAIPFRLQAGEAAARLFAHREALAQFDQALAHGPSFAQEVVLRNARIDALRHLGDVRGHDAEAEALMHLAQRHGDRNLEADAAVQRALALADASQRREALRVVEHAVALQPDNEATLLRALRIAGWAAMACGEIARARAHLQRALVIAERTDAAAACSTLSILVRLACDAGDLDEGQRLYDAARRHAGYGLRPMIRYQVMTDGARLVDERGDRAEAFRLQRAALALAETAGAAPNVAICRFNLMRMLLNDHELAEGRAMALQCIAWAQDDGNVQRRYMGLSATAQLAAIEERWDDAVAASERCLALCDELDDVLQRRMERMELARTLLRCGRFEAAREVARAAAAIAPNPPRVLLSARAAEIEADFGLAPERAADWLQQLDDALAAPPLPEQERRATIEHAQMLRAELLLALGQHPQALQAAEGVGFTAVLRARAQALRNRATATS